MSQKVGATSGELGEAGGQSDCPLCDQSAGSDTEIYRHLMVNHRKSELSDVLVETIQH